MSPALAGGLFSPNLNHEEILEHNDLLLTLDNR